MVVEATNGRKYEMPVGTPQGGALGPRPSMWREFTNDLLEVCKGKEKIMTSKRKGKSIKKHKKETENGR